MKPGDVVIMRLRGAARAPHLSAGSPPASDETYARVIAAPPGAMTIAVDVGGVVVAARRERTRSAPKAVQP